METGRDTQVHPARRVLATYGAFMFKQASGALPEPSRWWTTPRSWWVRGDVVNCNGCHAKACL